MTSAKCIANQLSWFNRPEDCLQGVCPWIPEGVLECPNLYPLINECPNIKDCAILCCELIACLRQQLMEKICSFKGEIMLCVVMFFIIQNWALILRVRSRAGKLSQGHSIHPVSGTNVSAAVWVMCLMSIFWITNMTLRTAWLSR